MNEWEQATAILIDDPALFFKHFDPTKMERHESAAVTTNSTLPLEKFDWAFLMPADGKSDMVQLLNIAKDECGLPHFGFRMLHTNAKWVWDMQDLRNWMKVPVVDGVPFPTGPFAGFGQAVYAYKLVSPRVAIEDSDFFPRIKKALALARGAA